MVGMSIIAEVKCARCDRNYSGVRSRCPYCGARRIGRGKYSEETDNSKGKMLVGILVLAVLVVAVVVLLATAEKPEDDGYSLMEPPTDNIPDMSGLGTDGDNISELGPSMDPSPPPTTSEEPSVSPVPVVTSVIITYAGVKKDDFTAKIGEQVPLKVKIEPPGVEAEVEWVSSNTNVFDVVARDTTGLDAKVTGKGRGDATLTVIVNGEIEAKCIVRVN